MCAWISSVVGGVLGTVGTIAANIEGDKTRRALNRARGTDPTYSESPYAKSRLGLASQLLNSKMPGQTDIEQKIYQTQANRMGQVNRNATDSNQVLALGAMSQGQTNQDFANLGISEAQDYYRRLDNWNNAEGEMTQEHHASFDDKVRRWQDNINITLARGQIRQQQGQNLSNLGSMFMGAGSMGMGGGKTSAPSTSSYGGGANYNFSGGGSGFNSNTA